MTMPPPPDPGHPAPSWNRPPADLGGPVPGRYSGPPTHRGTDGFAIAALAAGVIGAPVGLGFGIIALSQLKRSGQRGRGMAIAGMILSGLWVIAIAVVLTMAVMTFTAATQHTTGHIATTSARELRAGDCVNNQSGSTDFNSVATVPCARPHEGEAFAVFDLPAGAYPGLTEVQSLSNTGCRGRFGDYSDADPFNERLYMVVPAGAGWTRGNRGVVCIATPLDRGRTTGSLRTN